MSLAEVRIKPIREGLEAFGAGHSRHHCRPCDGTGFRILAISLWRWRWKHRCQFCQGTGWRPIGDPRELAASLLFQLCTIQADLESVEPIRRLMHLYAVRLDALERVFHYAGYRPCVLIPAGSPAGDRSPPGASIEAPSLRPKGQDVKQSQIAGKAMLDAKKALFNGGFLKFYAGTAPTNPDTALGAQTLLATFQYANPAFGADTLSGGFEITSASYVASSVSCVGSGTNTVAFARAFEADGTTVIDDYTVGTSGTDFTFPSLSWSNGETITLSSSQIEEPVD